MKIFKRFIRGNGGFIFSQIKMCICNFKFGQNSVFAERIPVFELVERLDGGTVMLTIECFHSIVDEFLCGLFICFTTKK